MGKILIVYGTTDGQAKKIADYIANELRTHEHFVDVVEAGVTHASPVVENYDGVVIGGSVHMGKFQEGLKRWTKSHADRLNQSTTAFFSVCLGILQYENAHVQMQEKTILTNFFDQTGVRPEHWQIFAGSLLYLKYGWFKRQLMRWMSYRAGGDTDVHRDYEYTDWIEVRDFARQVSSLVTTKMERALAI